MARRALLMLAAVLLVVGGMVWLVARAFDTYGLVAVVGIVLFTPLVLFAVMAAVFTAVRGTWWPVRELIRAAGALADGDYSARVPAARSRAMQPVVASFNDMARRLESADEQRRQLLADLGHELRTPLTVIRGELEAIGDGLHQPTEENLSLLLAEVEVMERLLEDLRTLSMIEAGSLALHPEPTGIDVLLNEVADGHRRRADELGVAVTVAADPIELVVDPVRIREVVSNLVVNALRAMPEGGGLVLRAKRSGRGAVIEVSDTGVGIGDAELVFERFHKGEESEGSGLGLTISRDLVRAHGGSISMESEPGRGTTVRVDLSRVAPAVGSA
jgi:two-component system OmpR family sensor kinase/two-component system sensor histidine kinase BaeS